MKLQAIPDQWGMTVRIEEVAQPDFGLYSRIYTGLVKAHRQRLTDELLNQIWMAPIAAEINRGALAVPRVL